MEEYCEFSETENCVEGLTKYGLGKLRDMSEGQLDEMDPYQRGASLMSECLTNPAALPTVHHNHPKTCSPRLASPN